MGEEIFSGRVLQLPCEKRWERKYSVAGFYKWYVNTDGRGNIQWQGSTTAA
jgi:hypothetical protein